MHGTRSGHWHDRRPCTYLGLLTTAVNLAFLELQDMLYWTLPECSTIILDPADWNATCHFYREVPLVLFARRCTATRVFIPCCAPIHYYNG